MPTARPFRVALLLGALHFLAVIGTATAGVMFFTAPSPRASLLLLGGIAASVVTWLLAYVKRRGVFCPLCKGTPLVNSGARPHSRAWRLPPLNHGTSAMVSMLATQRFRCMYCGELFDLLKTSSRLHYKDEPESSPR